MKKIKFLFFVLVGLGTMVFSSSGVYADIMVGDNITLQDGPGTTGGGEFQVFEGTYQFNTFCLEHNEYLAFGLPFLVDDISNKAIYGGVGSLGDELDPRTAFLYYSFRMGTLTGYDGTAAEADKLQQAIWYIEEESGGVNNNYVTMATAANWQNIGPVRVLNLKWTVSAYGFKPGDRAQDLLTIVPEPGTLMLLGVGLLGLAFGIRRKK